MEDWYRCTHSDFIECNGYGLMRMYGGYRNTLRKLLNYDFKEWKFGAVNSAFWKEMKNQREFMQDLAQVFPFSMNFQPDCRNWE